MGRNSNTFSKDFKAAKANKTLSKPRDIDYTSKMGYQDGSPFSNRPYIDINTPSGYIDMSNTGRPIMANGQYLPPYSGMHYMGTPVVREVPINLNLPNIDFTPQGEFNLYGNKHYLGANYYQPLPGGGFSLGMGSPTKFFNPNFSVGFNKKFQDGGWLNELPKAQVGLSHRDSIAHQADKILKYEVLRGGPGGTPLKVYNNPKYKDMLMNQVLPEVNKIIPHASAMEKAEAMDFIFNAGWDQQNNKIQKDPRAYALQEYYRKYDKSKLDKDGNWSGRKGVPYSFDQEYNNTIGKLSENDRRILMNKGRDWYYKNINQVNGQPNPNYNATWYGRIWNTNDFSEFNPNNPNFKPKKQNGGWLDEFQIGGSYTPTPVLNMTPQMQQMAFTPTTQKEVGDWVKRHGSGRLEESMSPLDFLGPAEIKAGMNMFKTGAKASAKALPKVAKETAEHVNLPLKNIEDFPKNYVELKNTGFEKDPYFHFDAFWNKKHTIAEHLKTPEGRARLQNYIDNNPHLQNLGKTVDDMISDFEATGFETMKPLVNENKTDWIRDDKGNIKYVDVDPNNAYNWYRFGYDKPSQISMGMNYTPYDAEHIFEHEFAHLFQRGDEIKGVDDVLANINLIPDEKLGKKQIADYINKYNPFNKSKDVGFSTSGQIYGTDKYHNPSDRLANLLNQKNYWLTGANRGMEKAAFAAEVRENLLKRGLLKNRYDKITPDMLKKHYKLYHNTEGNKYNLRLYDIMTADKNNFLNLSKALNRMPAVVPAVGAGYLGYEGLNNSLDEYKRGGVNPLMKARSKRNTTNKNIQSSVNKLFLRNSDLFGPGGKNIYDPETNKKLNTMSTKKKYGGDSGAPHNGQPTANEFFSRGWIPPGPVGFYKLGGQSTDEIAFPQQVPANYFFAGVPWQNDLGHFAYGGGLPGGANEGMPCMECGGYMQDGGSSSEYKKVGKKVKFNPQGTPEERIQKYFNAGWINNNPTMYNTYGEDTVKTQYLLNPDTSYYSNSPGIGIDRSPNLQDGGEQYGDYMAMGGIPQQYGGVNDGTMGTFKEGGNWIQKATASIKKRGTEGVCTGDKFGGPGCPPGSKRYNLAKTFRAMAKKAYGGTTDGVDQDDYISSRANAFNNAVRMNYGMAEADNQMKRLDQEQQALAQQAAMYAMPQAQYGMNYNPQMAQATANYNQAQGMLDQWNQQGKDSRNQFFGALGQGADNAYNRNSYIKWDLKKSPDADLGKAIRALQDVHTDYNAGYKAKEGGALQKYQGAGAVPKMAVGRLEGEDDYNKAKADFYKSQGFDDMFDNMYFSPQQDMYRNSAYANLPWMQPRNYMRYGMTPQYKTWGDSYSGGDGNMMCTQHGCIPVNHDPRIHQYPEYYQETPFYRTSANGQTYYDYGYPDSWRNINQYPGGAGGSWNTPGWGGPNPFYNQMFGNPNMYTTLSDVDVKRGLFGSMKNPKRVKMHFNTYFNPTTGRMESAPAADQSSTASTTSATPAATTPAATTTADNKSKLNPMQQKALDDVNKFIIKTNLYNDVQKGFDNPSELTEDQIADLRGPVTPSPINPDLERELNPLDPMMSMQARRINPNMPTPASRSVSAPTLDQAAEWMSNARNYYGNQMGQNTGVFNMPGANLPGTVQSQESSDAYRKPIVARDRAKAAAERELNINSTAPAPAKVYPPGVSTDRQKWLYDTYGQDRFSGITPGMAYGGYLPMAQNGVNNTDPNAIPAMSPMKPRTISLPPQQPQATPALQASPMRPVGGWELTKEKKTPWSGKDLYGIFSGAIGMGTNALLGNERPGMKDYINRQTMADNIYSAANPYRGDITQTGAGYGSQFGSLNQTPTGAYTKSGGYVYANGGAYETGVPMELTDEEIQAIMAAGGTVRYI